MSARRTRANERGFTLIELLVASIAGLFVVLAAFMISRGATRVFASEGRVANTQLNLRLGADRLRSDIERAGYMTTSNVVMDPDVCPNPNTLGIVARLQSVWHQQGTAATSVSETPQSAANLLNPDKLTLTGNFTSTDSYLAATIEPSSGGAGWDIILQAGFGSTARLLAAGETSSAAAALSAAFPDGRMLRIRNDLGSSQYVVVQATTIDVTGRPKITVGAVPAYTTIGGGSLVKRCGGRGLCLGCEVNPVQFVRYEVKSLRTIAAFAWAYPTTGGAGDDTKYELVRSELKPDGNVIPGTEEIISEHAVDLAFAFTVDDTASITSGATWTEPNIRALDFGDPNAALYAGDILASGASAVRPQRIRSVRYRLSTRSRFGDYPVGLEDGGAGLSRYMLAAGQFARVRTMVGDVALINQQGIRW